MILKASQRSGTRQLADHLLNTEQNEHVDIYELRGFMAEDLTGALQEIQAQAQANKKIKKPLFSMSLNPPIGKNASVADFVDAASRIEKSLGLTGQPRAIVFHEKEGRRHAHVVWSRIDEKLKAIKIPYFKMKLMDISRDMYLQHGWDLPKGLQNKQNRETTNFNLSEWQTAKRQEINPKALKAHIQKLWQQSDNLKSFQNALKENGFILAKGQKRSFVLVDTEGEVRALSRTLSIKTKEIKAKLGNSEELPDIEQAKTQLSQVQKDRVAKLKAELKQRHDVQLLSIKNRIDVMSETQREEREKQTKFHLERQRQERDTRQTQYQKGLRGLWQFVTGRYHKQKKKHEAQYKAGLVRDEEERQQLIEQQLKQRQALQVHLETVKVRQQEEVMMISADFVQRVGDKSLNLHSKEEFMQKQGQRKEPEFQYPKLDM